MIWFVWCSQLKFKCVFFSLKLLDYNIFWALMPLIEIYCFIQHICWRQKTPCFSFNRMIETIKTFKLKCIVHSKRNNLWTFHCSHALDFFFKWTSAENSKHYYCFIVYDLKLPSVYLVSEPISICSNHIWMWRHDRIKLYTVKAKWNGCHNHQ